MILKAKSPLEKNSRAGFWLNNPGDFLLSHAVSRAVPSAPAGLTSVFGMGTGVTLPTKSPENFQKPIFVLSALYFDFRRKIRRTCKVQRSKHKEQKSNSDRPSASLTCARSLCSLLLE